MKHFPIEVFRYDYCFNCNTQYSIEMYNIFGSAIGYSRYLDFYFSNKKLPPINDKYPIDRMICKNCKKEYPIDWSEGFPKPMRFFIPNNFFLNNFINNKGNK